MGHCRKTNIGDVIMRVQKIKAWFRKYPLMISVCYLVFYLLAFQWLEKNTVPKYIIHCKLGRL